MLYNFRLLNSNKFNSNNVISFHWFHVHITKHPGPLDL